jgi:hypothetical protein
VKARVRSRTEASGQPPGADTGMDAPETPEAGIPASAVEERPQ